MTTLYRPVLIESAEQAEALPVGTVATHRIGPGAAVRVGYGLGWSMSGEEMSEHHSHMLGWTALVPIEAEEETRERDARPIRSMNDPRWKSPFDDHDGDQWVKETRLVTPWEEA